MGNPDDLLAKLSREQLEAINKDLKSKVARLEAQSAAYLSWGTTCSENNGVLEDVVKKASNDGTETLDLTVANIGLRNDNKHWECVISAKEIEARHLDGEIASLKEAFSNLQTEGATLEGRVSELRDEGANLEVGVRSLNTEIHDKEALLEEVARLRADLKGAEQAAAQAKACLDNVEVEIITHFPDIGIIRRSIMDLKGASKKLKDGSRPDSEGGNRVKRRRKHDKS